MKLSFFRSFSQFVNQGFKQNKTNPGTLTVSRLREMMPHLLEGYLSDDEMPDSLALLPPPPEHPSEAFLLDLEYARKAAENTDKIRFMQAAADADLSFPAAVKSFGSILNIEISGEKTPKLCMLLRRVMTDAGLSTYAAKNHYNRERPFVGNKIRTCTPEQEEALRKVGSFPSGHAAVGWIWALILSEIFPEKKQALTNRGYEFGISRIVCHAHWHSDVEMGRAMAGATMEKLCANPAFQKDLIAVKKEQITISFK
ncbi:MAG: phosphatase PAP2 family protein [Flavobacterium nitrogenifigens]|uniref:acid phosphatase n=1 Tax=Flavobacterium nitrogenifigens TaxID=1617283 RepID=UPI00280A1772|nr:phosphatase PAP2 family protein [Flavobacterium nitrogenifigens]MDQ8013201.1 phosphatase PAP2 family protein [Flavobacterium nitrogenifigens]